MNKQAKSASNQDPNAKRVRGWLAELDGGAQ
jgi:hypothetical protein